MGFLPFLNGGYGKSMFAKVTTMDADLDRIVIESNWTGRHLFDAVCRIIGLREVWFFGLQYTNKKNIPCWLQMDKEIRKQDVPKGSDGFLQFLFLVKFYPEDVEEELIQDLTRHLFFLQIKQAILSMDLYCSPEASVLLASFAVQAMYGDCTEDAGPLELGRLLPKSVVDQYEMSVEMWTERIKRWWNNNAGQSREDAEMEYLRVAQDLEMYGILYYPICNKKDTDLHLGIAAHGLGIYKGSNRITPRPFFSWSEIKNISFKSGKFQMRTVDKSTISFRAQEKCINPSIYDLCIGTHNLYLRRRQPDTLEVQQMKAQADEERLRRQEEYNRLVREHKEKIQAEEERDKLKAEIAKITEELEQTKEAVRKAREAADALTERALATEKENLSLMSKASESDAENQRLRASHIKSEEALIRMERKAREAEIYAQRISMSLADVGAPNENRKPHYSSHAVLGEQVVNGWHAAPPLHSSMSHHQLMTSNNSQEGDNRPQSTSIYRAQQQQQPTVMVMPLNGVNVNGNGGFVNQHMVSHAPPPDPSVNQLIEFQHIRNEVEKSKKELSEKSRLFKERLNDFRGEIEAMKRDDRMSEHDVVHAHNVHNGFDKFTTLRMIKSKSASSLDMEARHVLPEYNLAYTHGHVVWY